MPENTEEQTVSESSNYRRGIYLSVFVFGLVCLMASVVLLSFVIAFRFRTCTGNDNDCHSWRQSAKYCGSTAVVLFVLGGLTLLVWHNRRKQSSVPETVISDIPAGDLERFPAPVVTDNHIPHRQPFVEASSADLPDYFTAVQNIDDVYLYANMNVWAEEMDNESLPPSYEQALKMAATARTRDQTHFDTGNLRLMQ